LPLLLFFYYHTKDFAMEGYAIYKKSMPFFILLRVVRKGHIAEHRELSLFLVKMF